MASKWQSPNYFSEPKLKRHPVSSDFPCCNLHDITPPGSLGAPGRALVYLTVHSPVLPSWGLEHKWRTANNYPSPPVRGKLWLHLGAFLGQHVKPRQRRRERKRRESRLFPPSQPASHHCTQPLTEGTIFLSFLQQVFTEHQLCARHYAMCWVTVKPKMDKILALGEFTIYKGGRTCIRENK